MRTTIIFALSIVLGTATSGLAQMNHADHKGAMSHGNGAQTAPSVVPLLLEPGQGAFAALSEVVMVLEADPDTDWSKVDLGGLRDHLVDMDRLVTDAVVNETDLPTGIRAVAGGDADTIATLRRMVPAHAAQLAADDRWTIAVSENGAGVELTVTSNDPAAAARIRGLGFFGLMASQDHHRAHHMRMARGENPHQH
jgi:hypothetical protein